nr:MarR family winged helix-turn-helix transcriptional regulator [Lysinibacter cavernae]
MENPLDYSSAPLAALLEVFTLWGSGGFIERLAQSAGTALDATSIILLTSLSRNGATRPSDLAETLGVGASNVSKMTKRLAELGLVERATDAADARASRIRLTADGLATMRVLVVAGDDMMANILASWPDDQRANLAELLQRFSRDAKAFAAQISE